MAYKICGTKECGKGTGKMKAAYMLIHSRKVDSKANSTILIGFYSSYENALKVIERYKIIIGFRDYPDDFKIEEWEADIDDYNDVCGEFIDAVFYLSHEYYDGVEYDYITNLGVYSTADKAKEAMEKYKQDKQFAEYPLGFCIAQYEFNTDHWVEGFDIYR